MSVSNTRRRGRPLGFILMVVMGWAGLRFAVVSLWPAADQPGAPVLQFAALEDAEGVGQLEADLVVAESPETNPDAVAPAPEELLPSDGLVEGLEPAPPAHLEVTPVPLPEAAAHNTLWMAASSLDDKPSDAIAEQKEYTSALK